MAGTDSDPDFDGLGIAVTAAPLDEAMAVSDIGDATRLIPPWPLGATHEKLIPILTCLVLSTLMFSCAEDRAAISNPEAEPVALPTPDSPDQKRVLAILGDPWHAVAPIHRAILGGLIEEGWQAVTILNYDVPWDRLDQFDLVLMSRNGVHHVDMYLDNGVFPEDEELTYWLTAEQEEKLVDYVNGGAPLLLFHDEFGHYKCGNGVSRLAKSCFITHPPRVEITVTPTGLMPELSEGITPFNIVDEEYEVIMDESETSVYLESHSPEHGRFAQAWAHPFGEGKVGVLIPGHDEAAITHPMVDRAINNMLDWLLDR